MFSPTPSSDKSKEIKKEEKKEESWSSKIPSFVENLGQSIKDTFKTAHASVSSFSLPSDPPPPFSKINYEAACNYNYFQICVFSTLLLSLRLFGLLPSHYCVLLCSNCVLSLVSACKWRCKVSCDVPSSGEVRILLALFPFLCYSFPLPLPSSSSSPSPFLPHHQSGRARVHRSSLCYQHEPIRLSAREQRGCLHRSVRSWWVSSIHPCALSHLHIRF